MTAASIEIRRRILRFVERFPGLHLRDLARRSRLSEALAAYHLEALEKEGFVRSQFDSFYRRFYVVHGPAPSADEARLLAMVRQTIPLQITILLLDDPGAPQATLSKKLGLAKSTVSYHIARLESAGLLLVEPHGVRLREPERVRNLLLRWRPPTDATERFASLWRSFYRAGHG